MKLLAADMHEEMSAADVLRLLQVTAARVHVMADVLEHDIEGETDDDGR